MLETTTAAVIALAALITALGVIHKKVVKPLVNGVKAIHDTYESVSQQGRRLDQIELSTQELHRNSGSSLRDAVDRIEHGQMHDREVMREHVEWSTGEFMEVWRNLAARDVVDSAAKTVEAMEDKDNTEGKG